MGCIRIKTTSVCGVTVNTSSIREEVELKTTRVDGASVSTTLICTIANPYYLEVEPKTVWVSPDYIRELLVQSNTNWTTDY